MPTYEYKCADGHHFEQFQRMSEPPLEACPTCGAAVERLLSAGGGLIFKGSGFYITDYRNDTYKKAAAADSGSGGAAPDGKAATGGEKPSGAGKPAEGGAKGGGGKAGGESGGGASSARPGNGKAAGGKAAGGTGG
jgi:putative FmdB family regulatory protein